MNSPAKLNLSLVVGNRRPDGRHFLRSVVAPLCFGDTVLFSESKAPLSCVVQPGDAAFVAHLGKRAEAVLSGLCNEHNLAFRAAQLLFDRLGESPRGELRIEKRIPLEAGLGGGSSNAATTLLLLNDFYGNRLALPELLEIAGLLGSDVPLFLFKAPALLEGSGEIVSRLSLPPEFGRYTLVLAKPPGGVSTAAAYEKLGRSPGVNFGREGEFENSLSQLQRGSLEGLFNDFASVVQGEQWYQQGSSVISEFGAIQTLLCGSGSTLAGFFNSPPNISELRKKLGEDWWLEKTNLVL